MSSVSRRSPTVQWHGCGPLVALRCGGGLCVETVWEGGGTVFSMSFRSLDASVRHIRGQDYSFHSSFRSTSRWPECGRFSSALAPMRTALMRGAHCIAAVTEGVPWSRRWPAAKVHGRRGQDQSLETPSFEPTPTTFLPMPVRSPITRWWSCGIASSPCGDAR